MARKPSKKRQVNAIERICRDPRYQAIFPVIDDYGEPTWYCEFPVSRRGPVDYEDEYDTSCCDRPAVVRLADGEPYNTADDADEPRYFCERHLPSFADMTDFEE